MKKKEPQKPLTQEEERQLTARADAGDVQSAFELGRYYYRFETETPEQNRQYHEKAAKYLAVAAAAKHPDGMYFYSRCLRGGFGADKDETAGMALLHQAADAGSRDAILYLSFLYCRGISGLTKNYEKAMEYLLPLAESGDDDAMAKLGDAYRGRADGFREKKQRAEAEKDYAAAYDWYMRAAKQENDSAMWSLGAMHEHGHCENSNIADALDWYCKAAEHGDASGAMGASRLYYEGEGIPRDLTKAAAWSMRAIELDWDEEYYHMIYVVDCLSGLGTLLAGGTLAMTEENKTWLRKWIPKAAEKNFATAQYMLAKLLLESDILPKNDGEAFRQLNLCLQAYEVDEGSDDYDYDVAEMRALTTVARKDALLLLARCYTEGRGTSPDPEQAKAFTRQATESIVLDDNGKNRLYTKDRMLLATQRKAEDGDPAAMLELAEAYYYGFSVKNDGGTALLWATRAAKAGNVEAIVMLGRLFSYGKDIPANEGVSLELYALAAAQGSEQGKEEYARFSAYTYYQRLPRKPNGYTLDELLEIAAHAGMKGKNIFRETEFESLLEKEREGDTAAVYRLANCYCTGYGTERNYDKAAPLYEKFLKQVRSGDGLAREECEAYKMLSKLYGKGLGVPKDKEKAKQMKLKAKEMKKRG